jgi:hypothetical protein
MFITIKKNFVRLVGKVFALILRKDKYTKSKIIKQHSEERLDVHLFQKMKKNYSFPQDKEKYNSRSKEL